MRLFCLMMPSGLGRTSKALLCHDYSPSTVKTIYKYSFRLVGCGLGTAVSRIRKEHQMFVKDISRAQTLRNKARAKANKLAQTRAFRRACAVKPAVVETV